jgi:hypothetical protein
MIEQTQGKEPPVSKRSQWISFMESQGWKVAPEEAERIYQEGKTSHFYDYEDPSRLGGFFESEPESDKILLVTEAGSFLRESRYLVRSPDGLFVTWLELLDVNILTGEKPMPTFDDFFDIIPYS